ncbi:hypothetical protein [Halorarius halobius]|nr:hypothetical protein [Halorarius halobius]
MFDRLRRALRAEPSADLRECRRCGTSVDGATCPACGSTEIASYRL